VKLAFFGTPEFAIPSLIRLHDSGHDIRLVLTQPDRPAGRGRRLQENPVKREALIRGLAIFQPEKLDSPALNRIAAVDLDVAVVVAYGLILPASLLRLPRMGCVNVHASWLPRYRGAAPVAHAILNGETITGVTTLLMDEGIDTGPILLQEKCPVGAEETAGELESRLAPMGAALLLETLKMLEAGTIQPQPQAIEQETYAPKVGRELARISWNMEPSHIARLVRAMNPRPGATTTRGNQIVKVWRAQEAVPRIGDERLESPGTVLPGEPGPRVACGTSGSITLLEIQMEGRRRVSGAEALRGRWLKPGDRFDEAAELGRKRAGPARHRL